MKSPACGWGCSIWREEKPDVYPKTTWEDDLERCNRTKCTVESSLWGGAMDHRASSKVDELWMAVWKSDITEAKSQLRGLEEAQMCQLLQQRRRFKVEFNPKILTGSVLVLAVLKYCRALSHKDESRALSHKDESNGHEKEIVEKEIVKLLLEKRADPNTKYDLFPAGAQHAVVTSPLCFIAGKPDGKPEALDLLMSKSADLSVRSTINYHSHHTILHEVTWARNEDVARMLLNVIKMPSVSRGEPYESTTYAGWEVLRDLVTNGSKSWHTDFPPLSFGSCSRRFTSFARALELRMTCVDHMLPYVRLWPGDVLKSEIARILPMVHPSTWNIIMLSEHAPLESMSFLLWIPTLTVKKMQRTLLEKIWTTLRANGRIKSNGTVCTEWLRKIQGLCKSDDHDEAQKSLAMVIKQAPKAATIILDEFFLQEPKVHSPNRNCLPMFATMRRAGMNTVLADTCEWIFPGNRKPDWQKYLTSPPNSWHKLLPALPWPVAQILSYISEHFGRRSRFSELCEVRVVHLGGMLHIRILLAMEELDRNDQVALLQECTTLRAVVFHNYHTFGRFRRLSLYDSGAQLLLLILLCTTMHSFSTKNDMLVLWKVFSALAFAEAMFGVSVYSMYAARMWYRVGGKLESARIRPRQAMFDMIEYSSTLGLIGIHFFWRREFENAPLMYTVFLCFVLLREFVNAVGHLSLESSLGELLIPMIDAFQDIKMIGMICVLLACWVVAVALIHVVQDYFGEEMDLSTVLRSSWVHLVMGDPAMVDTDDFDSPWHLYGTIHVIHMFFSVVLLNTLLATTIEVYSRMSETSRGRQVRAMKDNCIHWLALRDSLPANNWHQSWSRLSHLSPCQARFLIFTVMVFGVSILLIAIDWAFEVVPFVVITLVSFVSKILVLMESASLAKVGHINSAGEPCQPVQPRVATGCSIDSTAQVRTSTPGHANVNQDNMFLWICLPASGTEGCIREGENVSDCIQAVQEDVQRISESQAGLRVDLRDDIRAVQRDQAGLRDDLRAMQRDLSTLLERLPP
jgi:hypothetical protein